MAYANSVTKQTYHYGNKVYWILTVTETGVTGSTDEWSYGGMPAIYQVLHVDCILTAGSGNATSVDPQLGDATNSNNIFENTTASASTSENLTAASGVALGASRTIYGRAKANGTTAGVTGKIVTRIGLVEGVR